MSRAPSSPTNAPSNTNGQRMNASDAPTRRMTSISSARARTASRIVLMMMNRAMIPTMTSTTVPAVRRMLVTVSTRSTRSSMLIDVADARIGAQGVADDPDLGRVDQLDLEAGIQRVRVEVAGQVLAALGRHGGAEAGERRVAAT